MPDRGEDGLDWVRGAQMIPVLGREIEEGEQGVAVPGQALGRLGVLGPVLLDEARDRRLGCRPGRRHGDLPDVGLHGALKGLRHLVEEVGGLVQPTPLVAGGGQNLVESFPEAEGAVALRRGSDEHQHALGLLLPPGLEVDPVGLDINVAPGRQISRLPASVLGLPLGREAPDDRGRQVWGLLAQQRRQGLLEITCRDAAQIQRRQQGVEVARPPSPARQDRRGEPDALAPFGSPAVPDFRSRHRDGANPGLHCALGTVSVPDEAHPTAHCIVVPSPALDNNLRLSK